MKIISSSVVFEFNEFKTIVTFLISKLLGKYNFIWQPCSLNSIYIEHKFKAPLLSNISDGINMYKLQVLMPYCIAHFMLIFGKGTTQAPVKLLWFVQYRIFKQDGKRTIEWVWVYAFIKVRNRWIEIKISFFSTV